MFIRETPFKDIVEHGVAVIRDAQILTYVASFHHHHPLQYRMFRSEFLDLHDLFSKVLGDAGVAGRVVGCGFSSYHISYLYMYPALTALFCRKAIPFNMDAEEHPTTWLDQEMEDLGIRQVVCDESFYNRVFLRADCKFHVEDDPVMVEYPENSRNNEVVVKLVTLKHKEEEKVKGKGITPREDTVYVVRTSGTTGRGRRSVMVSEGSIKNNIHDFCEEFELEPGERIFVASPPTFDPFYLDFFLGLLKGAELIFASRFLKSVPNKLISHLLTYDPPNFIQMTPTLFRNLQPHLGHYLSDDRDLNRTQYIVLGGEQFPPIDFGTMTHFYNAYGVTEMSVWQSLYRLESAQDFRNAPIFDFSQTNFNMSDTHLELYVDGKPTKDEGVEGDIVVCTEKRICVCEPEEDPKPVPPEKRFNYCTYTGDRGEIRQNKLYFKSRSEDKIKVHGKRLSLREMESQIGILLNAQCHCVIHPENRDLIYAFVKGTPQRNAKEMAKICHDALPTCMTPYQIVSISFMPITSNGKVDKRVLLELLDEEKRNKYRDYTPRKMVRVVPKELWSYYTGKIPSSGSSFLQDGGDSILAVQLANQLQEACGFKSPVVLEKLINGTFSDLVLFVEKCITSYGGDPHTLTPDITPYASETSTSVSTASTSPENQTLAPRPMKRRLAADVELSGERARRTGPPKRASLEHYDIAVKGEEMGGKATTATPGYTAEMVTVNLATGGINTNLGTIVGTQGVDPDEVWKFHMGECVDAAPVISVDRPGTDHTIFIGSHSGFFAAVGLLDGKERWHLFFRDRVDATAALSRDGSKIYIGCHDRHMYCLDSRNGSVIWRFATRNIVRGTPCVHPSPKKDFDYVIFGSYDTFLYCLNGNTGKRLWFHRKTAAPTYILAKPLVHKTFVYTVNMNGLVVKLFIEDGLEVTRNELNENVFSDPAIVKETFLIVCTTNFIVRALNLDDLSVEWTFSAGGSIFTDVYITPLDTILFGAHDSYVYHLDVNGNMIWSTKHRREIMSTPLTTVCEIRSKRKLVAVSLDISGDLRLTDLKTGQHVLMFDLSIDQPDGHLDTFASPVICNGRLVVGKRDSLLHCYRF